MVQATVSSERYASKRRRPHLGALEHETDQGCWHWPGAAERGWSGPGQEGRAVRELRTPRRRARSVSRPGSFVCEQFRPLFRLAFGGHWPGVGGRLRPTLTPSGMGRPPTSRLWRGRGANLHSWVVACAGRLTAGCRVARGPVGRGYLRCRASAVSQADALSSQLRDLPMEALARRRQSAPGGLTPTREQRLSAQLRGRSLQ